MIDDIFTSIASKKAHSAIDDILSRLASHPNCPSGDKLALNYTIKVAEKGAYPDFKFYQERGYDKTTVTKSIAELQVKADKIIEFWSFEHARQETLKAINESESQKALNEALNKVLDISTDEVVDLEQFDIDIEDDLEKKPNGYKLSVDEIDNVTSGFQGGTLSSICAFTGMGKSTLIISSMFKNMKQGKTGILFSIEVTPKLALLQFFSRWLFEEKGIEIAPRQMTDGSLDDEMKEKLKEYKKEFNDWKRGKLLILDESVLSRRVVQDYKALSQLYKSCEKLIESVDFVCLDHINQVELMFKDMGNVFVRTLTSATKTFVNARGENPATIIAVQANREGAKRAAKRDGKYDLQAISELSEVEKSSYACVFMYTSDDMKLLQETKLCLLKHRLGGVVTEPVTVAFNPVCFVVGETVETVQFSGDLDFLAEKPVTFEADDFDEF